MAEGIASLYCPKCEQRKPATEFYKDYHRRNRKWCRTCARALMTERLRKNAEYVNRIKLAAGCMDCGLKCDVPEVYEFDHRPGENKVANVAYLRMTKGLARVIAEIAKCDIVCANCHRIRTVTRRDYGRSKNCDLRRGNVDPTLF